MFTDSVLPDLLRRAGEPAVVVHRVLHTSGMWESAVAEAMAPEVDRLAGAGRSATRPSRFSPVGGQTRVRISARAANRGEAVEADRARSRLSVARRSAKVFTASTTTPSKASSTALLLERGETVAVAESLTGGLLAGAAHGHPGSQRHLPRRDRRVFGRAER